MARRAPGRRRAAASPTSSPASGPRPTSYWELWVDGEKAVTAQPAPLPFRGPKGRKRSPEPIYGDVYLPRKFKIAVAWPGDNNVDVLANDVGIVPTLTDGLTGDVTGYNVYVGGGLGMATPARTTRTRCWPSRWGGSRPTGSSTSSRPWSRRSATSATATTATGPA